MNMGLVKFVCQCFVTGVMNLLIFFYLKVCMAQNIRRNIFM